ncbi:MAG: glycosyltransferase family 2 protein [Gemmatimonadaceae bacterium]
MFRAVVVIPVYNHDRYLPTLVDAIVRLKLPCILVDDGSEASCAVVIDEIVNRHAESGVELVRLASNEGKGGAVVAGIRHAAAEGFTHALQVDADGQHTIGDAPALIEMARANPEALVTGQPQFDESVPKHRLYLRYLTHYMVSINTLNFSLRDAMCGFRVYPVKSFLALEDKAPLGRRMDFDIDVLVRLDWDGVPILMKKTAVRYPMDGVSHFRLWRDNVLITSLHIRMLFGMVRRSPTILMRRWQRA